jgi:dephospho-CoA kinase
MLKIGITGGIGSGKTTVCRIFEICGIPVFYADAAAKHVMHTDAILVAAISEKFGKEAYSSSKLNRKYLADIVFNNEKELALLNSLVHPAVFRAFDSWIESHQQAPYVIKEAALLFESGSYKSCDYTVLVKSTTELRIRRVMQRDKVQQNDVESRMNKQFSDDEKAAQADYVITNDEKDLLIPQVTNLHNNFLAKALQ